ncbi:aminoacyl-tRNA hydrolase [Corynebacterium mustelae]|uniref:Peptidyl-tRNA hydrolase n=1 Tax=Corynebacterium mustelae TaxID=571915 RepID=A0A0G3GW55_9CORY|nr:aminoacyl-tRNA hydrolase [Corynebacterium mustelae]AKK05411.1 aminoacyl-tRNA hydrolase [Corynebacterium mustelae]
MNLWQRLTSLVTRRSPGYVTPEPAQWLVIGLGNPGEKYVDTRHNVGYMVIDSLLDSLGQSLRPVKGIPATVANVSIDGCPVLVARSTTFMNVSGTAVAPLCSALGIPPERVIVVHDELDLPHGKARIKQGGNENGHNGLKSTTAELSSRDYIRVRTGIGRPPKGQPVPDYVLSTIPHDEQLAQMISAATQAVRLICTEGLAKAQNAIHRM